MPALKSQVIIPVPPPTLPSATGPSGGRGDRGAHVLLAHVAAGDVVEPAVVALADHRDDDVVLVADARVLLHHVCGPSRRTPTPTDMVLVRRMGVSISPHSITWVSPETSPAPLSTKPPPSSRSMKMFPALGQDGGDARCAPGPCPAGAGPSPAMMVVWPTSTPSTSVMALKRPGRKRPSGRSRSRARHPRRGGLPAMIDRATPSPGRPGSPLALAQLGARASVAPRVAAAVPVAVWRPARRSAARRAARAPCSDGWRR